MDIPENQDQVHLVITSRERVEGSTEIFQSESCYSYLNKAELLVLNSKIKEVLLNKRWSNDDEDELSQSRLIRAVVDSLNECADKAAKDGKLTNGWTSAICNALFDRLDSEERGIECAFGSRDRLGQVKVEAQREWLVDFCAVLVEPKERNSERYVKQMLIAGEIEWHNNLGKDFEKLLVLDSLVCFFVFPKRVSRGEHKLQFYEELAMNRRASASGVPPAFVLAEYDETSGFNVRVLGPPEARDSP